MAAHGFFQIRAWRAVLYARDDVRIAFEPWQASEDAAAER
jgi:hypothetical protein